MTDHKILPVRLGRRVWCRECGRQVVHYRATRLIRKPHWRHATFWQGYIGEARRRKAELGLL